jgi:hypothetical protein
MLRARHLPPDATNRYGVGGGASGVFAAGLGSEGVASTGFASAGVVSAGGASAGFASAGLGSGFGFAFFTIGRRTGLRVGCFGEGGVATLGAVTFGVATLGVATLGVPLGVPLGVTGVALAAGADPLITSTAMPASVAVTSTDASIATAAPAGAVSVIVTASGTRGASSEAVADGAAAFVCSRSLRKNQNAPPMPAATSRNTAMARIGSLPRGAVG